MRSYLDHASVSPLRPEVIAAFHQVLELPQADPGRPYEEALTVRNLVEDARSSLASLARVTPRQVIFTSSLAESTNHAVAALGHGGQILASKAERTSTLAAATRHGHLLEMNVNREGHLDLEQVEHELSSQPIRLLCAQIANHETGVLNDVQRLVEIGHAYGAKIHLDASTAFGHLPLNLGELGADAITVSSELLGGPQGVAALIIKRGSLFPPLLLGGAQERARRAGLENTLGIVGFGVAAEVVTSGTTLRDEAARASAHIAALEAAALGVAGVTPVGDSSPAHRAPHVRTFLVEGVEAEPIVLGLDRAGVSIHSGSACSSESLEPSPVLAAMGIEANHSLRLSVGWSTSEEDINRFRSQFPKVVASLRSLGSQQS